MFLIIADNVRLVFNTGSKWAFIKLTACSCTCGLHFKLLILEVHNIASWGLTLVYLINHPVACVHTDNRNQVHDSCSMGQLQSIGRSYHTIAINIIFVTYVLSWQIPLQCFEGLPTCGKLVQQHNSQKKQPSFSFQMHQLADVGVFIFFQTMSPENG